MKKIFNKKILLGLASITSLSLLVGNSFADYLVTAANTLGATIRIEGKPRYQVNYFLPKAADSTEFLKYSVGVDEGSNLYDALEPYTAAIGDYTFASWHLDKDNFKVNSANYASKLVADDYEVNSEVTVYAKYVQRNVGYYSSAGDHYFTANASETTIPVNTFSYGTRIYSLGGIDEASNVNLTTSSGIYNLNKDSVGNKWTVERVVTIAYTSWWNEYSPKTHIYLYVDGNDNTWMGNVSIPSGNKLKIAIDAKYVGMITVRSGSSTPGFNDLYNDHYNKTVDIVFNGNMSGSKTYSSSSSCVYIWKDGYSDSNRTAPCHWDGV